MPIFSLMPHSQTILRASRGRHLDVAAGAIGDVAEDNFLRDPAAHADDEIVEQFVAALRVFVLVRQPHGRAERRSARNDRDLVQRLGVFEELEQQGVPGFVIGGVGLFLFAQRKAAAFLAPAHFVARFFELGKRDSLEAAARREQRGFVDHIGQFRAGVTGRAARDDGEIDAFGQLHFLGMHPQDFFAAFHVGQIDGDLAIETARAQQRRIEHVGPVGGRDDDDAFLGIEAIHLDEQAH